jgi:hypothetical protein
MVVTTCYLGYVALQKWLMELKVKKKTRRYLRVVLRPVALLPI